MKGLMADAFAANHIVTDLLDEFASATDLVAGFKYFDFDGEQPTVISVRVKGTGTGRMKVFTELSPGKTGDTSRLMATIPISPGNNYQEFSSALSGLSGIQALYFCYEGEGSIDFEGFALR